MSEPVLEAIGLQKRHRQGPLDVPVLHGVELQVQAGESVAIVGASGSGKSSLMHLLAGLDTPSTGAVRWSGRDLSEWNLSELGRQRNQHLGFVFQFHHLLPEFHALENVAMPLWIRRLDPDNAHAQAQAMLQAYGWPGNVRELENVVQRAVVLSGGRTITPAHLMFDDAAMDSQATPAGVSTALPAAAAIFSSCSTCRRPKANASSPA